MCSFALFSFHFRRHQLYNGPSIGGNSVVDDTKLHIQYRASSSNNKKFLLSKIPPNYNYYIPAPIRLVVNTPPAHFTPSLLRVHLINLLYTSPSYHLIHFAYISPGNSGDQRL